MSLVNTEQMASLLNTLATVQSSDMEYRRQGRLIIVISSAMVALAVALLLIPRTVDEPFVTQFLLAAGIMIYLSTGTLARRGYVRTAAYFLVGFSFSSVFIPLLESPDTIIIFYLTIPILITSMILPPNRTWVLLGIAVLIVGISAWRHGADVSTLASILFLVCIVAFLAYLGARSMTQALQTARAAQNIAEQSEVALHEANIGLEARVTERTADLQETLQTLTEREAQLQTLLADLQTSQDTVRELSSPIIPVTATVLIAPLIGIIDSARAKMFTTALLEAVERQRARIIILDITGVPIIDTQIAQVLVQTADAIRLLGAQVTLVGIRPEVAQTVVGLGVDLSNIQTYRDLEQALSDIHH
ncbi:MAG: STAS domain-containing protein [Chloroflexota bacterium]